MEKDKNFTFDVFESDSLSNIEYQVDDYQLMMKNKKRKKIVIISIIIICLFFTLMYVFSINFNNKNKSNIKKYYSVEEEFNELNKDKLDDICMSFDRKIDERSLNIDGVETNTIIGKNGEIYDNEVINELNDKYEAYNYHGDYVNLYIKVSSDKKSIDNLENGDILDVSLRNKDKYGIRSDLICKKQIKLEYLRRATKTLSISDIIKINKIKLEGYNDFCMFSKNANGIFKNDRILEFKNGDNVELKLLDSYRHNLAKKNIGLNNNKYKVSGLKSNSEFLQDFGDSFDKHKFMITDEIEILNKMKNIKVKKVDSVVNIVYKDGSDTMFFIYLILKVEHKNKVYYTSIQDGNTYFINLKTTKLTKENRYDIPYIYLDKKLYKNKEECMNSIR